MHIFFKSETNYKLHHWVWSSWDSNSQPSDLWANTHDILPRGAAIGSNIFDFYWLPRFEPSRSNHCLIYFRSSVLESVYHMYLKLNELCTNTWHISPQTKSPCFVCCRSLLDPVCHLYAVMWLPFDADGVCPGAVCCTRSGVYLESMSSFWRYVRILSFWISPLLKIHSE